MFRAEDRSRLKPVCPTRSLLLRWGCEAETCGEIKLCQRPLCSSYHGSEQTGCSTGRRSLSKAAVVVAAGVRGPVVVKAVKPRLGVTPGVGRLGQLQAGKLDKAWGLK